MGAEVTFPRHRGKSEPSARSRHPAVQQVPRQPGRGGRALLSGLEGLPWIIGERRVIPPPLEHAVALLDDRRRYTI
jgi:hypothetical protein